MARKLLISVIVIVSLLACIFQSCANNNELDLYYEIINEDKNTMLSEMKRQGILDQLSPNSSIFSTFHNEFGEE